MEKREIKIGDTFRIGGLTFIPLTEICLHYWYDSDRITFFYSRKPVAIAVVSQHNNRAIDISGEEIPFAELVKMAPHIESLLNSTPGTS
jgi:hypothetical protein